MKKLILTATIILLTSSLAHANTVKNVILMIGDGMGTPQVSQAILYRKKIKSNDTPLAMEELFKKGHSALVTTHSANSLVTDSAAAATAMACGVKTKNEMLGVDESGVPCQSILKLAKNAGKSTGLVSNTRVSHATPAAFSASNTFRKNENEIAEQIISEAQVDVILNGGGRHFIPKYKDAAKKQKMKFSDLKECQGIDKSIDGSSKRKDQKNLIQEAKKNGYAFACQKEQITDDLLNSKQKLLGVFTRSTFPHIQERNKINTIPSVADMTKMALKKLSKNPKGFFLMVESGLIDYAGHENDGATQLQETLDFDKAITVAKKYVDDHPDTMLIVTADHETGGYSLAYRKQKGFPKTSPLPGNKTYTQRYGIPQNMELEKYIQQKASFTAILGSLYDKVYESEEATQPKSKAILEKAAQELVEKMAELTPYKINLEEALYTLSRESEDHLAIHKNDPYPFCTHDRSDYHADRLGKVISRRTYTTWSTGTHTHMPVPVMAYGPKTLTNQVNGLMDNTDLFKVMKSALIK